jgi:hypothetical protein
MLKGTFRASLFVLLLATGCQTAQTFDVVVTNKLHEPITVWITRLQPTQDPQWEPPEVAAVGTTETHKLGGVMLEPGEAAQRVVTGYFSSDDLAMLRIYRSTDLNDILAIGRGSPDRVDLPLDPGLTDLDVMILNGQLVAEPHRGVSVRAQPPGAVTPAAGPANPTKMP